MNNNIIFADLSTYSPNTTIQFYESVFGWKYYHESDYYLAYKNNKPIVGMYETLEKFKQMRMPHFWMTYVKVVDVEKTAKKALEFGGIIEMEQSMQDFGKVALIRDPLGSGFTIYEGENLSSTRTLHEENTLIWNELHISDVQKIIPFYEHIFDWSFLKRDIGHFEIHSKENGHIANALEISNSYKGKYEYWVCTFGVTSLETSKKLILANGGSLIDEESDRMLFTDNSNEAFFYIKEIS